jgi:DNA-3-methyladenine glycosylase (3mg)
MNEKFKSEFVIDYRRHLSREFYLQPTEWVARNLIGKVLVRKVENQYVAAMIVETEAYLSENDFASHSAVGRTNRNKAMFERGGIVYVYKIYGVHHCVNFVTEVEGKGCAVLIRAGFPLVGIELFEQLGSNRRIERLLSGPGNFARGFRFSLADNGKSLVSEDLFVQEYQNFSDGEISISQRIGIVKSKELPLRFYLRGCKSVSVNPRK